MRITKRKILASIDLNHPVMTSDINMSAIFSITVTEVHLIRLSCDMRNREIMKVHRLSANNIVEWVWLSSPLRSVHSTPVTASHLTRSTDLHVTLMFERVVGFMGGKYTS